MEKDQKINLEDETRILNQKTSSAPAKKSGFWKGVLVGGVPGIMLGNAGTVYADEIVDFINPWQDKEENKEQNELQDGIQNEEQNVEENKEQYEEITEAGANHYDSGEMGVAMADSVNDDMSFGEAFATAREEVGAGGVFEWHGNLYNTFYAYEWKEMSKEEKLEFSDSVFKTRSNEDVREEVAQDEVQDKVAQEEVQDKVAQDEVQDEDIDIKVLSVGTIDNENGEMLNVAVASVDGHEAAFIDVDNDGYIDGILIDANDDGKFDESEVIETPESDVSIDMLAMMTETPEESIYENTPDYSNDGTSDIV